VHDTNILPVHDTNILPVHDTNILPPCVTHTLPPHTNIYLCMTLIFYLRMTHTLSPHTTNIEPPQAANILPLHTTNSIENVVTLAFFTNEERSENRDYVRHRRRLAAVSTKTVVQRRYSL
jgi:hypothetical protein